jgi:Flp pilus assembly protein TadG
MVTARQEFERYRRPCRRRRRGAAAVELAVLLPFLAFCFIVGIDFSRVFYFVQAVQNAAESGALYACQDATTAANSDQISTAAKADATNLSPPPTVTSALGTDADGNATVSVTVAYTFKTITNYPGIPSSTTITRTVTMRICPP